MSGRLDDLGRDYLLALGAHLRAGNESTLRDAYELGRRALEEGFGILDMANLHLQAIAMSRVSSSVGPAALADDFFCELLSPFEMTFRGYREANAALKVVNQALQRQRQALEIANRELESFSYSVSHDLRAPLRSIDGFSRAILEDYAEQLDQQAKKYLFLVRESAQQMGQLIEALLELSRVTRADLKREEVDLTTIARRISDRLIESDRERKIDFVIGDGLVARGDARLLAMVLENLLSNAWKFTSKRDFAHIEFGCRREPGQHIYFIRDNGAGFEMAYAGKLFTAFQRLHSFSEFEGNGVGLATVQRIVHRHGGRVWAEGETDRGATFYFTLESGSEK